MSESKKLHGLVKLDAAGEVVCFCSYDEYLQKPWVCREQFDCPEAMIEITVIPGTRLSAQDLAPLKKMEKDAKRVVKNFNSIKRGVSRLERDMRKFPIK